MIVMLLLRPSRQFPHAGAALQQTPWLRNTSSFANLSEHRKYVDLVLKEELGTMYIGLRDFHQAYFRSMASLKEASEAVFKIYLNS